MSEMKSAKAVEKYFESYPLRVKIRGSTIGVQEVSINSSLINLI